MTARYELLHYIGEDSEESNAIVDRFRTEVLNEAAAFIDASNRKSGFPEDTRRGAAWAVRTLRRLAEAGEFDGR
jgi:hypothetical protein